jgi:iron complex outermembrane receptor protein
MINGVPQNDPEDHNVYWINMPDLLASTDRVQVQRGAGLMNYGAAAMAGSVSVLTASGSRESAIRYSQFLGFQQFGDALTGEDKFASTVSKSSIELQSGLINNQYAISARLTSIQSDGYRQHSWAQLQSFFVSATRFNDNLNQCLWWSCSRCPCLYRHTQSMDSESRATEIQSEWLVL